MPNARASQRGQTNSHAGQSSPCVSSLLLAPLETIAHQSVQRKDASILRDAQAQSPS